VAEHALDLIDISLTGWSQRRETIQQALSSGLYVFRRTPPVEPTKRLAFRAGERAFFRKRDDARPTNKLVPVFAVGHHSILLGLVGDRESTQPPARTAIGASTRPFR
jgi:hypothetical protein